ncbi:MAG: ABC transporter substrate-binding protein [Microthrixaceae bacterium]
MLGKSGAGRGFRGRLLAASLIGVALIGAACGGGDGGGSSDGNSTTDPGAIVEGGEMTYALEAETSGGYCFPEAQLAASGMIVTRAIYDLLIVPADGEPGYAPYLLESLDRNEDATVWTLKLRDGVKFHDGTDLDSTVLKNNIDSWLGRYPGRPSLFLSNVLQQVDTVEILDDLTVQMTTKIPWVEFAPFLYGGSRLGIMAQAQLDDPENCDKNLIGTGPFMLEEWLVNDRLTATKNPNYWATDSEGRQLPYLDQITFTPVPDNQTRVNGLLSGEYDVIMTSSAEAAEQLIAEGEAGSISLTQSMVNAEVGFLMFNEGRAPFNDEGARRAVATAIDRELYNQVVNFGIPETASGPFAPGAPGYVEDAGFPEYDLEEAKRLVADYEQRTGAPLEFSYLHGNDAGSIRAAQFIAEQLEQAGINVNIQTREQATLIAEALGTEWDLMAFRNFPGGAPDGNYPWWYSTSVVNFPKMDDPVIDQLMDQGRSELDRDKALDIYEEVNRELSAQVHYVWLDWTLWTIATSPDASGVMGPTLPNGQQPSLGLSTGHATLGLHYTE